MKRADSPASTREMRRTLLRLRMEMHRQEIRQEASTLLQPLHQAQALGRHWREEWRDSSAPLWITGGVFALTLLGLRGAQWRRWLRMALQAFPKRRKDQAGEADAQAGAAQNANHTP